MKFTLMLATVIFLLSGCSTVSERDGLDKEKASDANARLGVAYMMKGQFEVAMHKLEKAIDYNEDNADAHHYIAELYKRTKQYKKAQKHFEIAIELAPNDSAVKNNYGIFLCDQKQIEKGIKQLESVLTDPLYKDKGKAYENMGVCVLGTGNVYRAGIYFKQALEANPNLPTSLFSMAQIEFDKQHVRQAGEYFERYAKLSGHTAPSLWLGYLIERKLGHKNKAASYAVKLNGKFPDSKEAKLLRKLQKRR